MVGAVFPAARNGCRRGGIGRRARLKIWYSEECVGSTPSVGTKPSLLAAGAALHWHHAFPHSHGCSVRDGSARFGSVPPSQTGALLGAVRDQNGTHLLLEELVVHRFGGARERCEESEREGERECGDETAQ